jgi:hypothetical protein
VVYQPHPSDLHEVPCFRGFIQHASAANITSPQLTNAISALYQVCGGTFEDCMPLATSIIWINEGKALGHHTTLQHHDFQCGKF